MELWQISFLLESRWILFSVNRMEKWIIHCLYMILTHFFYFILVHWSNKFGPKRERRLWRCFSIYSANNLPIFFVLFLNNFDQWGFFDSFRLLKSHNVKFFDEICSIYRRWGYNEYCRRILGIARRRYEFQRYFIEFVRRWNVCSVSSSMSTSISSRLGSELFYHNQSVLRDTSTSSSIILKS